VARVLIVDDDPDILEVVRLWLTRSGHQVLCARSGPEALGLVASHGAPEVAVLDVNMPRMSGLELLGHLRALPALADMPAVFLSAQVGPADVAAGRALGAAYLTKPFVATALLKAIERATQPPDTW
jgi:CheY-like chemotaxis protein